MTIKNKSLKLKFLSTISVLLLILSLTLLGTGCVKKELVNDPSTGEILPVENLESLSDGHFTATTHFYDTRGYAQQLDIIIKSNIITQVNFKETSRNSMDRLTLEGPEKYWDNLSLLNLNSLYFRLYDDLILSQNPDEIETISGATQTSERFIQLANAAIGQAKKGDHEPIKIDTFDTYTVVGSIDQDGFQGNLVAAYNGTRLTALTYDEIRAEDGKSKRKLTDSINNINYSVLFDTFIRDTLASQTLESASTEGEPSPEKAKFSECIRMLKEVRTSF